MPLHGFGGGPQPPESAIETQTAGPIGPMPVEMVARIAYLQRWACENEKESKQQALAFWALKVPAILGSGVAGVLALGGFSIASAVAGAIGAGCVTIDGVAHLGQKRALTRRAFYELRALASWAVNEWQDGPNEAETAEALRSRIMRTTTREMQRISVLLSDGLQHLDAGADGAPHVPPKETEQKP